MCLQGVNGNEAWTATTQSNNNPADNWNYTEQETAGNNGKLKTFTLQPPLNMYDYQGCALRLI